MKDVNEVKTERFLGPHSLGPHSLGPQPRRRRRWRWVVPLLLGIVGVVGAVVRNRRLAQPTPEWWPIRPAEPPTWQYRDQVATGHSPICNGVVRAERPSASAD